MSALCEGALFVSTFCNLFAGSMPERTEEMSRWGLIYKNYLVTLNQRVDHQRLLWDQIEGQSGVTTANIL
jgi:hypothetical protein